MPIDRVSADELDEIRKQLSLLSFDSAELDEISENAMPAFIGRFALERQLGSGSFGTVFIANDPKMSRKVAIKVAHIGAHASEQLRRRFLAEAHAAARMAHPNVVTVHECGEDDGLLYIVYQLCQGVTLSDWLADQPDRIEPRVAVEIVRQLAKGLAHAHVRGIVHRDMKPSNIVLHQEGDVVAEHNSSIIGFTPRITDFGLAHDLFAREDGSVGDNFLGTIDYMSPEQVQGGENSRSPTSDIYSLGVMMYRMLSGVLPSTGSNVLEILQRICSTEPIPIRYHNPSIPRDLAAICRKCLEKNPADRYQTCESLIADLNRWQSGLPIAARPRPIVERIGRAVAKAPVVFALAMSVLLISTASATLLLHLLLKLQDSYHNQGQILAASKRSESDLIMAKQDLTQTNAILEQKNLDIAENQLELINIAYRADLHLAYEDFKNGQLCAAVDSLDRIDQQIEGYIKPCFALQMLRNALSKARSSVNTMIERPTAFAIIPNSNLVVYGGDNGQLCLQNFHSGHVENTFSQPSTYQVTAIAVDSSSSYIAVGWSFVGFGGLSCSTVVTYRFNPELSEKWLDPIGDPFVLSKTCQSLSFSPDGKRLAMGGRYCPIVIKNVESNDVKATLQSDGRNRAVEFSPDGERILVLGREKLISVADATNGQTLATIPCPGVPQRAHWTTDGAAIAFYDYNSRDVIVIESVAPFKTLFRAKQSLGVIETIAVTPSGNHLIAGTRSGGFVAWDLMEGLTAGRAELEPVRETIPHAGVVLNTAVLDDCTVMSLDDNGELAITSIPCTENLLSEPTPTALIQLSNSDLGTFLAGFQGGSVRTIDDDGRTIQVLCDHGPPVTALASSDDGSKMAVGRIDGRIELWNYQEERQCLNLQYAPPANSLDDRKIHSIQLSPNGQLLAACGSDARLRVWQTNKPSKPIFEFEFTSRAFSLSFVGNRLVACGGMFEEICVFDIAQQKMVAQLPGTSLTKAMQFDATRNLLLSGHDDGRVRVHSARDWKLISVLSNSVAEISSLCISPDHECYLVGSMHGQVNLWDAETRLKIGTIHQFKDKRSIDAIEIRPDLRLITLSHGAQELPPALAISR